MATIYVNGLDGLAKAVRRDARKIRSAVLRGARKAIRHTAREMARNVPVAFDELRESIHTENIPDGAQAVADAPHAQAVEVGSRPHMPPLEPIIAWVKLRGKQGLTASGRIRSLRSGAFGPGETTAQHAYSIATQIKSREQSQKWNATDDVIKIAVAIQHAIANGGTKPSWFALRTLSNVQEFLDTEINAALAQVGESDVDP